ncbi:uncharacterized protein LOC144861644 [Branchiostoma floridae x Branchiostoma japonicum]
MASNMPDDFDEQFLVCPVCMLHFRDPRVLPCLHTFCRECLQEWATKQQPLECPTCRTQVSLPDQGVDGLRTNFYVNNLLDFAAAKKGTEPGVPCQVCEGGQDGVKSWCADCALLLCKSCVGTHRKVPVTKDHEIVTQDVVKAKKGVDKVKRKRHCDKHKHQELVFYCESCNALVCTACTVVDHRPGKDHNPVEITTIAKKRKETLQGLLQDMEPRLKKIRASVEEVDKNMSMLLPSKDTATKQAKAYVRKLETRLKKREKEILSQIDEQCRADGKALQTKKEAIELELAGLTSAQTFCQQAVEHGSDVHILEVGNQVQTRIETLLAKQLDLESDLSEFQFVENTAVTDFEKEVQDLGGVKTKIDASKCVVVVNPAVQGVECVAELTTMSPEGRPCVTNSKAIKADMKDPLRTDVTTKLKMKSWGVWGISFVAKIAGQHRLEVKVNSQQVPGSPFDVEVKGKPVLTIGRKGSGMGELDGPVGVAVDEDGNIAVVEQRNKRVQIFDKDTGQSLRSFTVDGEKPFDIAVDSNGRILVTSWGENNGIRRYSKEGELLNTFKPDCMRSPLGLTVLQDGRMVVVDHTQKSCLLLQPDGSLIREIGKGQLQQPVFVSVDESRDVMFVTNQKAHKAVAFDLDGNLKFDFGKEGQNDGEFKTPFGVTFDATGNIIVGNAGDGRVQVFRPDGTFIRNVGTVKGNDVGGLALTPDGDIAVACWKGHCIELYRYMFRVQHCNMASNMPGDFDEQFLACPVCMLHFRDPKVLPCLHTFCRECLQEWATKQTPLECPTCRTQVSLPDQGVDGLRTNFYVNNLLDFAAAKKGAEPGVPCQVCEGNVEGSKSWCADCAISMCESCTVIHRKFPYLKDHQVPTKETLKAEDGMNKIHRKRHCDKHENQELVFYCESCKALVCTACTVVDHRPGKDHNPVEIATVARNKKETLQALLQDIDPRLKGIQTSVKEVERKISNLAPSKEAATDRAKTYFRKLADLLQKREKEILNQIDEQCRADGKALQTKKEAIEFELAGLTSAQTFCQQAVEHGSDVHILEVGNQVQTRVETLLAKQLNLESDWSEFQFVENTTVTDFEKEVEDLGGVKTKIDISKCKIVVKPVVQGFEYMAELTVMNQESRPCVTNSKAVTANMKDPSGTNVPTQQQMKGLGEWEISFVPKIVGNHRLEVKVNSQQVPGSPFEVEVKGKPVLTIGGKGSGVGELKQPIGVAVDQDGNIAVVEQGNKRVQIFDIETGQSLSSFPVDGENPFDIDVDSNGRILVTSWGENNGIRRYSKEGELLNTFKPDCMRSPHGLTVLQDGRMVLVNRRRNTCLLLQPDGSLIREIGKGQLQLPLFVTVDESRGVMFVTDKDAHKVFAFDLDGNPKFDFGKRGQNDGEFQTPRGITVDPAGNIIVGNAGDGRVQVFGPDGTFIRKLGTVQGGYAQGVALTPNGHIAVACWKGHCIELYRYM